MTIAGYLLLIGGFLAGAFAASQQIIPWMWFVPAVAAGAIGVIVIKRVAKAHAQSDHVLHGNKRDLEESLDSIVAKLTKLRADKEQIPAFDMRFEIDKLFRDDLIRFVDAREALTHLYGLQAYADVMSEFAAGERYINRVWSASADGYVDEVLAYIDRAHDQFTHAQQRLRSINT